jgi:hypothetical protein
LNVVARIRGDGHAALGATLDRISNETLHAMRGRPPADALIDFGAVPGVHYARWVIVPGRGDYYQSPGGGSPPASADSLAFSVWYDGPEGDPQAEERVERRNILAAFVAVGRSAFDGLYANCEEYPEGADDAGVVEYLLERYIPRAAAYFGSPGRSCRQILEEARLARSVRRIIDDLRAGGALPDAPEVRRRVVEALGESPPDFPPQQPAWGSLLGRGVPFVSLLLPAATVALPWLLVLEARDPSFVPVYSESERGHVEVTTSGEDLFFQNALSNVVEVKSGWFRRQLLRIVLYAIDTLASDYFVHGKLGKISSIHAAHWYLIDGGRRLAFVSNYDSSWESYLGDFIDQVGNGLTAVWSNTSGYPRTHFLAFAGSDAGNQFKAWSHHIQVRTRVWYAAYPNLSIVEINDATLIRRGLADPRAVPPEQWLARVT